MRGNLPACEQQTRLATGRVLRFLPRPPRRLRLRRTVQLRWSVPPRRRADHPPQKWQSQKAETVGWVRLICRTNPQRDSSSIWSSSEARRRDPLWGCRPARSAASPRASATSTKRQRTRQSKQTLLYLFFLLLFPLFFLSRWRANQYTHTKRQMDGKNTPPTTHTIPPPFIFFSLFCSTLQNRLTPLARLRCIRARSAQSLARVLELTGQHSNRNRTVRELVCKG